MELIREYAGLSMVCGAAMLLLPPGGLRRTAALAMGLVLMLFWLQGLTGLLHLPAAPEVPATLLVPLLPEGG